MLDRISYDDLYQLQFDTCCDYFKKNNEIYIMAQDEGSDSIIGYINYSPVKKSNSRRINCSMADA